MIFNFNLSFSGYSSKKFQDDTGYSSKKFQDDKGLNVKAFNDDKPLIEYNKTKTVGLTLAGGILGGTFVVLTGGIGPAALGVGISVGAALGASARKIASFTSKKILKNGNYAEWEEMNSLKPENTLVLKDVTEKSRMIFEVINTIEIDKRELIEIVKGFDIDLINLEGDDLDRLEIFKDELGPYIGEMKKENDYRIDTQYYPNISEESIDHVNDEIEDEIEDYPVKSITLDANELFENKHAKNHRLQYLGAILLENISAIGFINKNIALELSNININIVSESTDLEIESILFNIPQNKLKIFNQVINLFEKVYKSYPNQLKKLTNTLSLTLFGDYSSELLGLSSYLIENGEKISDLLPSTRKIQA